MNSDTIIEDCFSEYEKDENKNFYIKSSEIEAAGYCEWPRIREIIEFSKSMNYKKIGIAFCLGLLKEAKIVDRLLSEAGFEAVSVICKTGAIPKERIGITDECKVRPGTFESMCNPIAQAKLLNEQGTDFNVVVGLCVGHDSMFYKYSEAMVTTLLAKDRVLAHNPAGALYCSEGYFKNKVAVGK
jgi:uncharacterized metal-binding protein